MDSSAVFLALSLVLYGLVTFFRGKFKNAALASAWSTQLQNVLKHSLRPISSYEFEVFHNDFADRPELRYFLCHMHLKPRQEPFLRPCIQGLLKLAQILPWGPVSFLLTPLKNWISDRVTVEIGYRYTTPLTVVLERSDTYLRPPLHKLRFVQVIEKSRFGRKAKPSLLSADSREGLTQALRAEGGGLTQLCLLADATDGGLGVSASDLLESSRWSTLEYGQFGVLHLVLDVQTEQNQQLIERTCAAALSLARALAKLEASPKIAGELKKCRSDLYSGEARGVMATPSNETPAEKRRRLAKLEKNENKRQAMVRVRLRLPVGGGGGVEPDGFPQVIKH